MALQSGVRSVAWVVLQQTTATAQQGGGQGGDGGGGQAGGVFGAGLVPTTWEEFLRFYGSLVGDVIAFVLAFAVVYLLGKFVLAPLAKRTMEARGFEETIQSLAEGVIGAIVLFAAVAVAFTVAGFGTFLAAFATLGGALALAAGFAAQDLLGNFVAGIFILRDKPFRVGDWIEQDDIVGTVEDIDLRVTTVRTFDNEKITVPNSELADNAVKNPVAYDKLRQKFVFGVGYDEDIEQAKGIILEEASEVDGILQDPGTSIRVTELADSYVGLQTRFWIDDPGRSDAVRVLSDLVHRVKDRCDAEGIEMPYPYRELTGSLEFDAGDGNGTTSPTDD